MIELSKGANTAISATAVRLELSWRTGPGTPDVDAAALLLGADGKVRSDKDFVFYNQPVHPSGTVRHESKITEVGAVREGLVVDTVAMETGVQRLIISAAADGGTFHSVSGLVLRLIDLSQGAPVAMFEISGADTETAMVAGELYRHGSGWKFRAIGQGYASGLAGLATDYGITVDDDPPAHQAPQVPPARQSPQVPPAQQPPQVPPARQSPQVPPAQHPPQVPPARQSPQVPPAQLPPAQQAPPAPQAQQAPPAPISFKKQKLISLEKKLARESPALLDLTKRAAVSLEKRGLSEHDARVALCLDISGSMGRLFDQGKIQALAERILALALRFDDDGEVDVFLFGRDGYQAGGLSLANHRGYIDQLINQYGLQGGTYYGKAMRLIRRHYFGADHKRTAPHGADRPVYVMFVTDGATFDEGKTREQVVSSSFEPLFWQFIALGKEGDREFRFLQRLDDLRGRYLDNADFFTVDDPARIPDDALFDKLMTEYPNWLAQARAQGLLPRTR